MIVHENNLARDLDHVLTHTENLWEELRGERLFVTGGTGFFGCWVLETFAWANANLDLNAEAVVLTRNPGAFATKAPHLAHNPAIRIHKGDFQSFTFPEGKCPYVLHAATETDSLTAPLDPVDLFDANVTGTRRVLEFVRQCGARKLLFTSSGAVYGPQPAELTHIPEDYVGAPSPLDLKTAYGQSKRVSEFLCAASASRDLDVTIARCFAFVGPHLPLRANFAIGNFVGDVLEGKQVHVGGDGTPMRSYLYAADLAVWLWTILLKGRSGCAYNVGSDEDLSIAELARLVGKALQSQREVVIAQPPGKGLPARYVPSIDRARKELGLEVWVDLPEAIRRTAEWNKNLKNESL